MDMCIYAFIQNNPELKVIKFLFELLYQVINEDDCIQSRLSANSI